MITAEQLKQRGEEIVRDYETSLRAWIAERRPEATEEQVNEVVGSTLESVRSMVFGEGGECGGLTEKTGATEA